MLVYISTSASITLLPMQTSCHELTSTNCVCSEQYVLTLVFDIEMLIGMKMQAETDYNNFLTTRLTVIAAVISRHDLHQRDIYCHGNSFCCICSCVS